MEINPLLVKEHQKQYPAPHSNRQNKREIPERKAIPSAPNVVLPEICAETADTSAKQSGYGQKPLSDSAH